MLHKDSKALSEMLLGASGLCDLIFGPLILLECVFFCLFLLSYKEVNDVQNRAPSENLSYIVLFNFLSSILSCLRNVCA